MCRERLCNSRRSVLQSIRAAGHGDQPPVHLRFFISSPGDVARERTLAQEVVEQEIPKDPLLRGQLTCEAVRWDDPAAPAAMPAALTPQEAVNRGLPKPSQCDVVVLILWSRMGTPLPDAFRRADGSAYLSGSEWEYEDALRGNPPAPPPHVLVYRCTSAVSIDPDQPDAAARLEQRGRVRQFFDRFRNPDGSLSGGFAEYDSPEAFRDHLRNDLRAYVQQRLAAQAQEPTRSSEKAPPPFGEIARALWKGRVVLFIGDRAASTGRLPAAVPGGAQASYLPSGVELSHVLAEDMALHADDDDLAEVSSYYETFQGRPALRERLRQILVPQADSAFRLPPLYGLLAEVPVPLLILSAGFDTQIEQAFRAAGKPYDLVIYPADRKDLASAVLWWRHGDTEPRTPAPNELDIDLATTTVIFKMHGSVRPENDEWDGFVITEDDHVEFLSRVAAKSAIPSLFFAHLRDRSLLFVGCRLHDWNLRVAIRSLSRYFARRTTAEADEEIPSWAVDEQISELEVKLWRRRGVYPFQMAIDEFVAKLRERAPR